MLQLYRLNAFAAAAQAATKVDARRSQTSSRLQPLRAPRSPPPPATAAAPTTAPTSHRQ